jgi:hypothetical protein
MYYSSSINKICSRQVTQLSIVRHSDVCAFIGLVFGLRWLLDARMHVHRLERTDIASWWKCTLWKYSLSLNSWANWVPCSTDLCDEYYSCLIGMSLLSSPSRSHPTHRKGRCSHDVIPHASAIASLLIVYASIRFPGVADVVPVTGKFSVWQWYFGDN